jgi:hypothetical protein
LEGTEFADMARFGGEGGFPETKLPYLMAGVPQFFRVQFDLVLRLISTLGLYHATRMNRSERHFNKKGACTRICALVQVAKSLQKSH